MAPTEDLPPPSYSEATTTPLSPNTTTTTPLYNINPPSPATGLPLPSPLTTHLRTLPARLHATQLARQTVQAATEFDLTALMVPHVEAFLADLTDAVRGRVPAHAELTLVPASAVPVGASMSGAVERGREGEVVRVGRVNVSDMEGYGGEKKKGRGEKGAGGEGGGSGSSLRGTVNTEFGEWGRFDSYEGGSDGGKGRESEWWFRDEDMARRLAAYLRPEPNLERKHVQATVVEKKVVEKEKSGWGRWGLGGSRKKTAEQSSPGLPSPVSPGLPSPASVGEDDAVTMTVRAEEVTFRRENDFGVWESMSGWGIVVTVRLKP